MSKNFIYICELCQFSGKNPSALKRHNESSMHKNKEANAKDKHNVKKRETPYLFCDHCEQLFTTEKLSQHILKSIEELGFERYTNILNVP